LLNSYNNLLYQLVFNTPLWDTVIHSYMATNAPWKRYTYLLYDQIWYV